MQGKVLHFFIVGVIILNLIFPMTTGAEQSKIESTFLYIGNTQVYKNNSLSILDPEQNYIVPYRNLRVVYVPLKFLANEFNAKLLWDDTLQLVILKTNDKEVSLADKSNIININNINYKLNSSIKIQYGRTFVPVVEFSKKVFNRDVIIHDNLIEIITGNATYSNDEYKNIADKFIKDSNGFIFNMPSEPNYIDDHGRIITNYESKESKLRKTGKVSSMYPFHEGFARAQETVNSPYCFINEEGEWLKAEGYIGESDFSEGMAAIYKDGKYGYINTKGETVIPIEHTDIHSGEFAKRLSQLDRTFRDKEQWLEFSEGLVPYFNEKSKEKLIGYMDKTGKTVILPKYEFASSFSNGRAKIGIRNQNGYMLYGYIDKKGNVIIPPKYLKANDFSEGLAFVESDEFRGFIDTNGENVLPVKRLDVEGGFSEGFVAVINRSIYPYRYGFMNKYGRMITSLKFETDDTNIDVSKFQNGLAYVISSNTCGYINTQGKYVWKKVVNNLRND